MEDEKIITPEEANKFEENSIDIKEKEETINE